ncbi:MAG: alpha/beta hydrolase [Deltaproteobacteria bacterium]|nr:alpha/beta hydrolase [Deltaproteobacteria bacterium]
MPRIRTGAVELAYDEVGDGEVVVFISGTSLDRTAWGPQVAVFSDRYRCITIDNRDAGESTQASAAYTPRDMAADVDGLLAALDLPAAHVVGHSLGGAIGQELALAAPDRVRTLTLIGSWARNDEYTRALFRTWKRLRATLDTAAFLEAMLLTGVGHTFLNAIGLEPMVRLFLSAPHPQNAEGFCRQVDADLAHDTLDRLGRIQPPTLVLAGDEDKIFPAHHPRQLADGIGAELLVIPGVGHSPALENAAAVNAALETFFASH